MNRGHYVAMGAMRGWRPEVDLTCGTCGVTTAAVRETVDGPALCSGCLLAEQEELERGSDYQRLQDHLADLADADDGGGP